MCWVGNTEDKKIAEKNIPIIKICFKKAGKIISLFYNFEYVLNKVYTTKLIPEFPFTINHGFHSYAKECELQNFVHMYNDNLYLVSGYIPKGSVYYINTHYEIVSNSIVLTKCHKLFTKLKENAFIKREAVLEIQAQIAQHSDLAIRSTTSLTPGGKDFDADAWVKKRHELECSLRVAKIEYALAMMPKNFLPKIMRVQKLILMKLI